LWQKEFFDILQFWIYKNRPDMSDSYKLGKYIEQKQCDFQDPPNSRASKNCSVKEYAWDQAEESINFIKKICGVDNLSKEQRKSLAENWSFEFKEFKNINKNNFDKQKGILQKKYPGSVITFKQEGSSDRWDVVVSYSNVSMYDYVKTKKWEINKNIIKDKTWDIKEKNWDIGKLIIEKSSEAVQSVISKCLSPYLLMDDIKDPSQKEKFKSFVDEMILSNKNILNSVYWLNQDKNILNYKLDLNIFNWRRIDEQSKKIIDIQWNQSFEKFVESLNSYISKLNDIDFLNNKFGNLYTIENVGGKWNLIYYTLEDYSANPEDLNSNSITKNAFPNKWWTPQINL